MTNLIFGCGYLGERVAQRWHAADDHVTVVTRSTKRAAELSDRGYSTLVADIAQPGTLQNLPAMSTVLYSIGFDRTANQSIDEVYAGGLRNVLFALQIGAPRLIYISTTGVYGPGGGEWVDERTPPDPRRDGGRASLAAEQTLAAHSLGKNAVTLRLAGIYGPERIPFRDKLSAGEPIPAPTSGHLNLIHVDDAAQTVLAAQRLHEFNNGPRVYCVSDGHPAQRGEFYREVARQIGAPAPKFVEPEPDTPRAIRSQADRLVRNTRMLDELGIKLSYPDYRAGLAAILGT